MFVGRRLSRASGVIVNTVPDWKIQGSWAISAFFATGALWYFLSNKDYPLAIGTAIAAICFSVVAVQLHRQRDSLTKQDRPSPQSPADEFARRYTDQPSHIRFVKALPKLRAVVYENAQEGWSTGASADMREASYDVIDFLEYAWLRVAELYPANHFDEKDHRSYIRDFIKGRFAFHWAKYEPEGPGTGGTIVCILTGGDVIDDLEAVIADTVSTLFMHADDFDCNDWLKQWRYKYHPAYAE